MTGPSSHGEVVATQAVTLVCPLLGCDWSTQVEPVARVVIGPGVDPDTAARFEASALRSHEQYLRSLLIIHLRVHTAEEWLALVEALWARIETPGR